LLLIQENGLQHDGKKKLHLSKQVKSAAGQTMKPIA